MRIHSFWLGLLLALGLAACASDKSLVSHAMNNVAARDNGFFLAREQLRATEATLNKGRVNDYNRVLAIYPVLDSTTVRAARTDMNEVIKRASLPIQHRPGSDYTDDAYLVVAWARFYKMEFDDAELTFKYVNSTSKDPIAKQEALIGLMRTFMMQKRPDDARAVSELLNKERGLPRDARELFLTRADYYLQAEEPKEAIAMLEKAIPLIPQKNERSRSRFILAQLYQEQDNNKAATEQLNQILKRNPPYELDFFAKLMLGQVSDLNEQDKARLDKYYAKLLKDEKNKEYRDKIYYEMARVQYRQQHYADALALLRTSAKTKTPSRSQKGYTYWLAGRIYYENLHKYQLAAAYYDSTTQAMPKENPLYAGIKERADVLREFAKQYTIIETQDSLQALVKLPADQLTERLNTYAAAALKAKHEAEAKALAAQQALTRQQQDQASRITSVGGNLPGGTTPTVVDPTAVATGAQWYFDNPTALGTARNDFIRKWGDRKLQDNWRTVSTPSTSPNDPANGGVPVSITGNSQTRVNGGVGGVGGSASVAALDPKVEQETLVGNYRQSLPTTPDKLEKSNEQVEAAMYELGGIYKELLKERQKGYETYAGEVQRYPRGTHAPDADYLLYLYYKGLPDPPKAAEYAANLQRYFPTSTYAKLIADPLYREHELALHNAVSARLDSTYALYKDQYFTRAKASVARIERQYPKSDLNDRVAYLKMLLAVRTQPGTVAQPQVAQFIKDYPDSPLQPQAQALAASFQKAGAGQLTGALASTDKPVISVFRPGEINTRQAIDYDDDIVVPMAQPSKASDAPATTPATPTTTPATRPTRGRSKLQRGTLIPAAPAGASAAGAPTPTTAAAAAAGTATPSTAAAASGTTPPAGAANAPAATPTPASSGELAPAATPAPAAGGELAPAATPTTGAAPDAAAPATPAAPTTAYATQLSAAHAVVLVYPKGTAPTTDLAGQLTAYNGKFFRAANLTVLPAQPLGADQELVVVRALPGSKVAQSYATKLRGPQSPLGRLRGQGYQALVISMANLALLQASGDLAGYQQFYQQVYH